MTKCDPENAGSDKAKLPTPEPSDINKAALVNFDEIEQEIKKIKSSLEGMGNTLHFRLFISECVLTCILYVYITL